MIYWTKALQLSLSVINITLRQVFHFPLNKTREINFMNVPPRIVTKYLQIKVPIENTY